MEENSKVSNQGIILYVFEFLRVKLRKKSDLQPIATFCNWLHMQPVEASCNYSR